MEKFIKIENKTGIVCDTKIIDLEPGKELQNSIKSLTINPLIPGEVITGSMEIYIGDVNFNKLIAIVYEASDNMKSFVEAYNDYVKTNSIWRKLFQALAKGFLSL